MKVWGWIEPLKGEDVSKPRYIEVMSLGLSPESFLRRASGAADSVTRAKYATRGLATPGLEPDTQLLLLRQLYMAHMERERFEQARTVADQMIDLGPMPDVVRQDAARACLAEGDVQTAVQHLRIATRVSPASRRAFHFWSLGSVFYFAKRYREALGAFSRAQRWAVKDKELYNAQAALSRHRLGQCTELKPVLENLCDATDNRGYYELVAGELGILIGDEAFGKECLERFVRRCQNGKTSMRVGLRPELAHAKTLLASCC